MSDDLDDLVRRLDPDRWLSSRFVADGRARADLMVLYAYDHELARAPRVASNPLLGEIRLAWWREVLDEVFDARAVRRHPTAQALAELVGRRRLPRLPLEALIDGRYRELDPAPMAPDEALTWARETAGGCAALAAGLLDGGPPVAAAISSGAAWALGRLSTERPDLLAVAQDTLAAARTDARQLTPSAFPAVAHAALVRDRPRGELARRIRLTLAVARGRI